MIQFIYFLLLFLSITSCLQNKGLAPGSITNSTDPNPDTDPDLYDSNYSYFNMKIFLAGPMNGAEMNTGLGPFLPTTDPYGVGVFSPTINSLPDVVDWIKIEFRDSEWPYGIVKTYVGLLLKDGTLVDPADGSSTPKVDIEGDYWVLIKHRNHLPVRSYDGIRLVKGNVTNEDYSTEIGYWYSPGLPFQTSQFGSIFAIRAGEINGNCEIEIADQMIIQDQRIAGATGYQSGDVNFNGSVTVADSLAIQGGYSSINDPTLCGK